MATFQQLQGSNVRRSLLLIGVIVAISVGAGYFFGVMLYGGSPEGAYVGVGIAGAISIVLALVSWFGGADIVLKISGAREIDPNHPRFRQLYNIVEEVKIAAGVPMPRVYVIEDPSPNAFATGRKPEDGRVAVTTGLMEVLEREELQGVIAHEMAHIKNRDILYATVVGIMVGMVAILSDMALRMMFWGGMGGRRDNDRGGGQAQVILMIVGVVFLILAPIFAHLVKMAISRQREYLADATGAQFTRNPAGLASALTKISGSPHKLRAANHGTAHMFISNPFKGASVSEFFSTHPPAKKRIDRLMAIGAAGNAT